MVTDMQFNMIMNHPYYCIVGCFEGMTVMDPISHYTLFFLDSLKITTANVAIME